MLVLDVGAPLMGKRPPTGNPRAATDSHSFYTYFVFVFGILSFGVHLPFLEYRVLNTRDEYMWAQGLINYLTKQETM